MIMLRRTRWHLLVAIAALGLFAAACSEPPEDPTADDTDDETTESDTEDGDGEDADAGDDDDEGAEEGSDDAIVIGISLPLTGDFSEPGQGIQRGYETWADMINEEGGLLGREVELIFRDDGSDPNQVVSDYESLITSDEVDLVFGPFSTRLVVPAAEVAEEFDMLFLEPAGAAAEVFEQGFENLFYTAPAVADDHYNYLADYILELPDDERPQTVAVASLDDPFAQGTAYGLRDRLEEEGLEIVADEVYPPDQTDFSSVAARIADTQADLFIGGTQFEDSVGLVRSFQELGYQPQMAAFSTGPTLPEFPEAVGDAAEGLLSPVGWDARADFPGNQEFVERYEELHDEAPSEDGANGFTVGEIAAAAIEAVGCADPSEECQQDLIDHVRENEFETIVGPLSFDEAGRPQGAHMIQQYLDGSIEIVLPTGEDVTTADLVHPKPEW